MQNLSAKELKAIAKIRGIKGYKSMSEEGKVKNHKQIFLKQEQKRLEKNSRNQGINFLNQK